MKYYYKDGKMYEIKDEEKTKSTKNKFGFYFIIIVILFILGFIIYIFYEKNKYIYFTNNLDLYLMLEDTIKVPADKIVASYKSYDGKFVLHFGDKDVYGLRKIMAQHTSKFFPNYPKKTILFDKDFTIKDIIKGLKFFTSNCILISSSKDAADNPINYYLGYVKHKKLIKCILVVSNKNHEIIDFYPLDGNTQIKVITVKREITH